MLGRVVVTGALAAMMAMLEAFETEARHWCCERGIDPDGSAPGIMVGPLGFAPEKYWVRRARQLSLAMDEPRDIAKPAARDASVLA